MEKYPEIFSHGKRGLTSRSFYSIIDNMKDKDLNEIQNHHIVPDYICKELGLTTSYKVRCGKSKQLKEFYFKENHVLVTRKQHAEIHWGYRCKNLSPLLEVCSPEQWVLDMIPLGDVRDVGAAQMLAVGEIDGIDSSGENHWTHGLKPGEHPMNGFKHSEETKKKMSESAMGKIVSEETKEKLRVVRANQLLDEEYLEKNRKGIKAAGLLRRGVKIGPMSEETKKKVSISKKEFYAKNPGIAKKWSKYGEEHQSYSHGMLVNARNDPAARKAYTEYNYTKNREKILNKNKEWRIKNKEKRKAQREELKLNPTPEFIKKEERRRAYDRAFYAKNKEKNREKHNAYHKEYNARPENKERKRVIGRENKERKKLEKATATLDNFL